MEPFNANAIRLDNFEGIRKCVKKPIIVHCLQMNFPEGFTVTSNGWNLHGNPGDYLMFAITGEKYICTKDVFEATYEILQDETVTAVDVKIEDEPGLLRKAEMKEKRICFIFHCPLHGREIQAFCYRAFDSTYLELWKKYEIQEIEKEWLVEEKKRHVAVLLDLKGIAK